jgi:hypothetical protein
MYLPGNQRNLYVYSEIVRAARILSPDASNAQLATFARHIFDRLDVAGRHDAPDGLVSDIDLRAAIDNPGAICG